MISIKGQAGNLAEDLHDYVVGTGVEPVEIEAGVSLSLDLDKDGIPDIADTDRDNDNLSDIQELVKGADPLDPDTDDDGIRDDLDAGNLSPVLGVIGDKTVAEGFSLNFTISATDPDPQDTLTYSASALPSGASFTNKVFNWTPSYTQAGSYVITFTVSDGSLTDSETITITVNDAPQNQPPVLALIGNKTIAKGANLSFTVSAQDPDGNTLTYSATPLPTAASFMNKTFNWTPGTTQAGSYVITFTVSDGVLSDSETITITVTNQPPELAAIGNKTIAKGTNLNFTIYATDPNPQDPLTYSATPLPSGASFANKTFNWTPNSAQVGSYTVIFSVSDGSLTDSEAITITVSDVLQNRPPVLTAIGNKTVAENSSLNFTISATDPDGDSLTYSVSGSQTSSSVKRKSRVIRSSSSGLPKGAKFDSTTHVFDWTPDYDQAGSYNFTFTVSDGKLSNTETITITVSNVNRPPKANLRASRRSGRTHLTVNFNAKSSKDPDGDTLTYFWSFGDGETSTSESHTHIFGNKSWRANHIYDVTLTVTDPSGASSTDTISIKVYPWWRGHDLFG